MSKKTDQQKLLKIVDKALKDYSFEKGNKYVTVELDREIPTSTGYEKQDINFVFDDTGKLEEISISTRSFKMTERGIDVTNYVTF